MDARSAQPELVVTGHEDGSLYAWDLRKAQGTPTLSFREGLKLSEEMWVSGVRLHPTSNPHFISGHYSGDLKVWDVRKSDACLHSVKAHQDKLLGFDLIEEEGKIKAASGGADGRVVWTSFNWLFLSHYWYSLIETYDSSIFIKRERIKKISKIMRSLHPD